MKRYNPSAIEPKWQKVWDKNQTYKADLKSAKPKYIAMSMFNYPSGAGIHIGHAMNYTISDVLARFKRQQGFESYHPVGWDSFGLPAENYAIKAGVSPQESMATIIPNYHKQYKAMGWSNDWSKEIATHDPRYYKWTQWIFSEMFRSGLAYQDSRLQWWCDKCQTVLANEQVVDGKCWRHDSPDDPVVEQREVKQWFFKITDYADELLEATDALNWTESVKLAQKNWIGRSEGAIVKFELQGPGVQKGETLDVFTTAHDTIYGVTFMVVAPEHPLVGRLLGFAENSQAIDDYVQTARRKTELERESAKGKSGVAIEGVYAINPADGQKIPVWVADYVLMGYGTGAIMAVPAHDERDHEFAQKYNLPIAPVVEAKQNNFVSYSEEIKANKTAFIVANSAEFNGMNFAKARPAILKKLVSQGSAEAKVNYKMRDWSVSRQRYWGAPIPIVYCDACKQQAEQNAHTLNFYHQKIWNKITARTKTIESRADNPEEPDRRFKNIKQGDYLRFVNKKTGEVAWAKVRTTFFFASLADLFKDKQALRAVCGGTVPETLEALQELYANLAEGYAEKIKQNGLVAWEFELVTPGVALVPDAGLPVVLPELKDFKPSGDGRSALARATNWLKAPCPTCGKPGERETDTLDTYICSSWYMLRYFDSTNDAKIFDSAVVNKWMPIDFYNGADHATAHMIYARFVTRFFHKKGLVANPEPFKKFLFNGKITAQDGRMFSKSKGNGIDPLEVINSGYGADALRTYLMFASPPELWTRWDPQGVPGAYRFLSRLWTLVDEFLAAKVEAQKPLPELAPTVHRTIKKVTEDIDAQRFNTAIAAQMQCINDLYKLKAAHGFADQAGWRFALESLVQLVAPFAPHIAEELWQALGHASTVHSDHWPKWDDAQLQSSTVTVVVQVNGKLRAKLEVAADAPQAEVERLALAEPRVAQFVTGSPKKVIYVPGKIVNIVV